MAALILDASVLIGLLDTADAHHGSAVDDVEAADQAGMPLLTPASAYSETLVAFARAGRVTDARAAIAAMGISVEPLTAAIAETAAVLRAEHERLRLSDAIVLATVERSRVTLTGQAACFCSAPCASSHVARTSRGVL